MNCSVHPDRQAYEKCAKCGAPVCMECGIKRVDGTICQACMVKEKSTQPAGAPGPGQIRTGASGSAQSNVSYGKPVLFGLMAAIISAVVWEQSVVITHYKLGLIAVVVGALVGFAVLRGAGGSLGKALPAIGALCAGFAILLGEFLIMQHQVAVIAAEKQVQIPAVKLFMAFPLYLGSDVGIIGWVIIAFGIYNGWKIPKRAIEAAGM